MADQEFLASFAVEIDESGVSRLQQVLEENRDLAEEVASAFEAATAAIREYEKAALGGDNPSGEGSRDDGGGAVVSEHLGPFQQRAAGEHDPADLLLWGAERPAFALPASAGWAGAGKPVLPARRRWGAELPI